ncbi:hypothetical protein Nmel_007090 [Mimus melanotis]
MEFVSVNEQIPEEREKMSQHSHATILL